MTGWTVELVGDDHEFSLAELRGALDGDRVHYEGMELNGKYALFRSPSPGPIMQRLALSRRLYRDVGAYSDLDQLKDDLDHIESSIKGTFRVAVRDIDGTGIDTHGIAEELHDLIPGTVALRAPETELRLLVGSEIKVLSSSDSGARKAVLARDVMKRPYRSPVSLRSPFARVLVNLSRMPRHGRFADPFCGGGGILMEASSLGASTTGIDIAPDALDGAKANLDHFGLEGRLIEGDLSMLGRYGPFDSIATDPPYGRATSVKDEGLTSLYMRMFEQASKALVSGGTMAVALPAEWAVTVGDRYLERLETYPIRVHRSLTRWFTAYRK